MRYIIPALFLTTPALADTGAHLHPHGSGDWLLTVLLLALVGGALLHLVLRK